MAVVTSTELHYADLG